MKNTFLKGLILALFFFALVFFFRDGNGEDSLLCLSRGVTKRLLESETARAVFGIREQTEAFV